MNIPEDPTFDGVYGCQRQPAGRVRVGTTTWQLYHFVYEGTRVYSMMATLQNQENFDLGALQTLCTAHKLAYPMECVRYNGGGVGLLYSPFTTLHEYCSNPELSMDSLQGVLKELISKMLFVQCSHEGSWVMSSFSMVVAQGWGATLLRPSCQILHNQDHSAQFRTLREILMNLMEKRISNLYEWTQFLTCLQGANSVSQRSRLIICPILIPTTSHDMWHFISRACKGVHRCPEYRDVLSSIRVPGWQANIVQNGDVPEAIAVLDCSYATGGYATNSISLLQFLRNFDAHSGERYDQLKSLQNYKNRLPRGSVLSLGRLESLMKDKIDGGLLKKLKIENHATLNKLLSIINTGPRVSQSSTYGGESVLRSVSTHYPSFFIDTFAFSYKFNVPAHVRGLDYD